MLISTTSWVEEGPTGLECGEQNVETLGCFWVPLFAGVRYRMTVEACCFDPDSGECDATHITTAFEVKNVP